MDISQDVIRRLGRAAGENTATGAFQRLEQSVDNWRSRNATATDTDVELFRHEAEQALDAAVADKYHDDTN